MRCRIFARSMVALALTASPLAALAAQAVSVLVGTHSPDGGRGLMARYSGAPEITQTYAATNFATAFYLTDISFFVASNPTILARGTYSFFVATILNGVTSPFQSFKILTVTGGGAAANQRITVTTEQPFFYDPTAGDLFLDVFQAQHPPTETEQVVQEGFQVNVVDGRQPFVTEFDGLVGQVIVTPEPATLAFLLTGVLALGVVRRRHV